MTGLWRWLKRAVYCCVIIAIVSVAAALLVVESGIAQRWLRGYLVQQMALRTGAQVTLGGFHLHIWELRAELDDLTLRGTEPASVAPLFHAKEVQIDLRVVSFWKRSVVLEELVIDQPEVAIRTDRGGRTNLPSPRIPSARSWEQTLFSLQIARLELKDGSAYFNDVQVPLAMVGRDFVFGLHFVPSKTGDDAYVGNIAWSEIELSAKRDLPFQLSFSSKFTLHHDSFELDELICNLPHSQVNLRATLASFSRPDWDLRYRGQLSLDDLRRIIREPTTPTGRVEFSGQAHYTGGDWTGGGHVIGHDVSMHHQWFHAGGMEAWGDYQIAGRRLLIPVLSARAIGGTLNARIEMNLDTYAFRADAHLRGASLGDAFASVDNPEFPVDTLHWDGIMDVDSVLTWSGDFQHFRSTGTSRWSPPAASAEGIIPASAEIQYDYFDDRRNAIFVQSQISTPSTTIAFDGTLGSRDSALELRIHAVHLNDWADFINDLRGADSEPVRFGGEVLWGGRILGPIGSPTFSGQFQATNAIYDKLAWEQIDGALEYSPDALSLTKATVRHGRASALIDLNMKFDGDWSFLADSPWTLEARVERAPTADLQSVVGTNYPLSGLLTGDFRAGGRRDAATLDGDFTLDEVVAKGVHFDRLSGVVHIAPDEWRVSHAELEKDAARVTGEFLYHPAEQTAQFNLSGHAISLTQIDALQSPKFAVGGLLDFELQGSGPLRTPIAQGDFRVANLTVGNDVQGNLTGRLASDGKNARLSIASDMKHGSIAADLVVGLTGDEPVSGHATVTQIVMDTFISAGLHLKQLTGHSSVDGEFTMSGNLRQPDSIEVAANISRIAFSYQFVDLKNDGPIRLTYRRNEIRIDQARLHGPNTDLQLSGSARFDRERPLHFNLSGAINLRFIQSLVPDLLAQGEADLNAAVEGTISNPHITGRATVRDASATYADFPAGLSHLNGDFVFDQNRLLFDHVTTESGGGQLTLSGSVTYGEGTPHFEVTATTQQVRVRYPTGMSWLVGGTLQLSGSTQSSILSGQVEVKRLLFAQDVDVASFFAAASQTGPGPVSSSQFLQNLSFDIAGHTSPGARIEWTGAQLEIDSDVRLRGTWDHPVMLGHIHLLGGQMAFRGNNFTLTRGDINFANPFRLDPVLNVEATSVISQYQVTINFSGPASRLQLSYRSDPPLPDTDIIALLAIGSTGEESALRSTGGGSQNYGATALLSEAISSGLGGPIERLFGISHFRVDPFLSGTATESNAAARVTIEQQVTHDITVTYSSNTSSSQYQLIQVEYSVKKDLSIVFLRDINGTYGLDIKFVKHFK
ncbi:MAG: translocation/assembly module TamB domain-containing protein [Candidatus Acidiferrales bacterium]